MLLVKKKSTHLVGKPRLKSIRVAPGKCFKLARSQVFVTISKMGVRLFAKKE